MKQLKGLLKKEWQTNRHTFLIPLWFICGFYGIGILGFLINLIKGNKMVAVFSTLNMPPNMKELYLFSSSASFVIGLGFIAMISSIILADSLINGGYKRKCEILHLSQPVSMPKIIAAKYLFMTLGTMLLLAIVSFVNSMVLSVFFNINSGAHMYFGIVAWAQTFVQSCFTVLFISSLYWMFAGLFKRRSFVMGTLTILAIQIAIGILNYTANLQIPSLISYIVKLSTVQLNMDLSLYLKDLGVFSAAVEGRWKYLLDAYTLQRVILSAVFFLLGSWLYNTRELS
ncbi:MAG: hypothetical protein M0P99_01830 [Candidatus Cloacimonetes bacterium]|nr:hypothetical protein [Candidatus Cloacimonadota bacterium]